MKSNPTIEDKKFLNIGCGPVSRWIPNTEGLDIIDFGQKWVCNVMEFKPPYKYDVVFLHHVYEHWENPIELIDKLSEFLKPKGMIDVRVPIYPYPQVFLDPTHKNFPVFPDTFKYYTKDSPSGHIYSKKEFEIIGHEKDRYEWEGHCTLRLI
jgi:SAM-dependent methyltransferase